MNTDLTTLGNTLPAELREQFASSVAADLARLGGTGGNDTIQITQDKKFQFPDGTTHDGPIELIIGDFVYRNEYYPGLFNRKEPRAPTCFAVSPEQSALTPTKNSPKMQVEEGKPCSTCQWDRFGTSPQGEGKACKNTVFMAVLQADATEDTNWFVMKTSPTGIKYLNQHVAKIGRQFQLPIWTVVSSVFFDPNMAYPSLRFGIIAVNPILELTRQRLAEARARLLQEPDFSTALAT